MSAAGGGDDGVATRRVGLMVKLWPTPADAKAHGDGLEPSIAEVQAIGDRDYPGDHPNRRMSPAARDLFALGKAAEAAGYRPGDTIPPKRKRATR